MRAVGIASTFGLANSSTYDPLDVWLIFPCVGVVVAAHLPDVFTMPSVDI